MNVPSRGISLSDIDDSDEGGRKEIADQRRITTTTCVAMCVNRTPSD